MASMEKFIKVKTNDGITITLDLQQVYMLEDDGINLKIYPCVSSHIISIPIDDPAAVFIQAQYELHANDTLAQPI